VADYAAEKRKKQMLLIQFLYTLRALHIFSHLPKQNSACQRSVEFLVLRFKLSLSYTQGQP